ncbi:Nn.00g061660.m01.CDS01 [Neocucurbitaria sp. VM-36]
MSSTSIPKVVPAQLSFLAIYNPSLGSSDETFHQQIVFYYSKAAKTLSKLNHGNTQKEHELREQENEKLRQVGLAQGMVGFAKSFSNGDAVDSVETQKSRIVLHELENGWWILASIDLTQLPAANSTSRTELSSKTTQPAIEYSSREVSPPALLIQQLVRAQNIFLLHHGLSLEDMFSKHGRTKFCGILEKYWSRFAANWDVLLHGSPAVDMYGGMKLAAGGELGMGVGEEEWGSSERDVLEDFARRTDGLVDVMVSRFGEASPLQRAKSSTDAKTFDATEVEPWLGSGKHVHAADGVVFSGLGAIGRKSLRDLSHWVESIYCHGEYAYGVKENPTTDRRRRRRRNPKTDTHVSTVKASDATKRDRPSLATSRNDSSLPPGIPPPIVKAAENSLERASAAVKTANDRNGQEEESKPMLASLGDTETWMKYMTLGYGTAWGGKKTEEEPQPDAQQVAPKRSPSPEPMRYVEPAPDVDLAQEKLKLQIQQENDGYFVIGLRGDMLDVDVDDDNDEGNWNNRIPIRTIYAEVDRPEGSLMSPSVDSDQTPSYERDLSFRSKTNSKLPRLQPVVYVHRPFIYTFLFRPRTNALPIASFYRDIHNFFSPLHRSLDKNTSPDRVAARLSAAFNPYTTMSPTKGSDPNTQPIYDLVYDPRTLTVHSSIPNIPDPATLLAEGSSSSSHRALGWSRVEALNVHSQILATVASTRRNLSEIERTCKTSRGRWVVWMRLPPSRASEEALQSQKSNSSSAQFNTDELREAFLVRMSRDASASTTKSSGSRFASGMWSGLGMGSGGQNQRMGGAVAGWGPKGLAEGIGIDARRYVEELLSLNR